MSRCGWRGVMVVRCLVSQRVLKFRITGTGTLGQLTSETTLHLSEDTVVRVYERKGL